jgi:HPt (histidine-containing phosphotransfer) domain-containing protein
MPKEPSMPVANDMTKTLERRLHDLRERFVGSLPERLATMAETLRQCQDGVPQTGGKLDRQFHTLAGTAGTYGLHSIAAAAVDGEDACGQLGGDSIEEFDARYLWSLIEELQYAIAMDAGAGEQRAAVSRFGVSAA